MSVAVETAAIFSDTETEKEFRQNGFVVRPLLNAEEIAAMMRAYEGFDLELNADFVPTQIFPELTKRRRINSSIREIMEPPLRRLIPGYHPCVSSFFIKRARGQTGTFTLHPDPLYIEPNVVGVNVWCPLLDVNEENGCLSAVRGSHTFLRHLASVPYNPTPWDSIRDIMENEFATKVPMSAGEAFIFDSRLLHASNRNASDQIRIAAACAMIPDGTLPRIYYWNKDEPSTLKLLRLTEEAFVDFDFMNGCEPPYPDGITCTESIEYTVTPLTLEEVEPLRPRSQSSPPPQATPDGTWLQRLFGRLGGKA